MLTTSPADAVGVANRLKGAGMVWLDHALEKMTVKAWELREWVYFLLCLLVLEGVVWRASLTKKAEDLLPRLRSKKGAAAAITVPARKVSLPLPLRQLLNQGSPVRFLGSDGMALMATLLEDAATGNRTVQIADVAEPTIALISVGPLPRCGGLEECGAVVHRYSTGYTIGSLKADGKGSWSLNKGGRASLRMTSSAPFTFAVSANEKEVAWAKPRLEPKDRDYVDFSICEGGDPVLPVACVLALLVASSAGVEER